VSIFATQLSVLLLYAVFGCVAYFTKQSTQLKKKRKKENAANVKNKVFS
jgi:hypothetical protein